MTKHYRGFLIAKFRILDHAAVSEEERRQARRGVRADAEGGNKEEKQEAVSREEMTGEEDWKMGGRGGKEECDGLVGIGRCISGTGKSWVQQERCQRQAGGLPQTPAESKGNQERTETAMEATGASKSRLCINFLEQFGIKTLETSPCHSLSETKKPKLLIWFLPKIRQKIRKQYDLER